MKILLRYDDKKYLKKLAFYIFLSILPLFIIFILYKVEKDILFFIARLVLTCPEEVYAFLGLNAGIVTGNCAFYLLFASMPLHILFSWKALYETITLVVENETSGRIYRLCNQYYNRNQLIFSLYVKAVARFFIFYFLWNIALLLFMLFGSFNSAQRIEALKTWSTVLLVSIFVYLLFISIGFLYAVMRKSKNNYENACYGIVLVPWILANFYKLIQLINMLALHVGIDLSRIGLETITKKSMILYWISPLSWCNPFAEANIIRNSIQAVTCIIISIVLYILAQKMFLKKDFYAQ